MNKLLRRINPFYAAALLFSLLVLIPVLVYARYCQQGELGRKGEYAFLQAVEYDHRDKVGAMNGAPIVLERGAHVLHSTLGVPSKESRTTYVWIQLDELDKDGEVKVMPGGIDFMLSCAYLLKLNKEIDIDEAVFDSLQRDCDS